jgi:hypothetical protein
MQLLDRYLSAIKTWLPKKQRDDIAAELAANLHAEADDRASGLGRPLTEDEVAALLKQHGSPILVASRYQEEGRTVTFGRQLIGSQFHFAPVLTALHLPILIIGFINLAQHWINLAEPDWRWLPAAAGWVMSAAGLIILYPLLGTSPLISISEPNGLPISPAKAAAIQNLIALGMISLWIGIMIVGAIYAWRLVWMAWQAIPHSSTAPRTNHAPLI